MKKIHMSFYSLVAVLLLFAIIIFSFMTAFLNDEEIEYKVAVILDNSQSSSWDVFKAGLERAAEDYAVEIYVVPTDDTLSSDDAKELVDDQIVLGADAIIMQLKNDDVAKRTLENIAANNPVVIVDANDQLFVETGSNLAVIGFDNEAIGQSIYEEVSSLSDGNVSGKRVGIIAASSGQKNMSDRLNTLTGSLNEAGAVVEWSYDYESGDSDLENQISGQLSEDPVDILIALDNECLEAATKCKTEILENRGNLTLIGIGNSNKVLYFLDTGIINSLIVPDYFEMGYRSVKAISEKLDSMLMPMVSNTCQYRIVYRDTMFDEELQRYLYVIQ